jgi:opacity protein-like surface antigen
MNKRNSTIALALAFQLLMSGSALAQSQPAPAGPGQNWSLRAGLGFTSDPGTFLMNFEAERYMRPEVTAGLAVQLGVDDNTLLVAPMVFGRFIFDLSGFSDDRVRNVKPFVQAGVGFTHLDVDLGRGRNKDDTDFLMSFGFGLDYPLNNTIDVGSRMLINVVPSEVLNERIYFSWEIVSIRYRW